MNGKALIAALVVGTVVMMGAFYATQEIELFSAKAEALTDVYKQWKVDFNIHVGASEDTYRFTVFAANHEKIQKHNGLLGRGYTLGLNHFTHLTTEEFSATRLGLKFPKNYVKPHVLNAVLINTSSLKSTIDWTAKMNAVKDQGQCGSCWAFSAVGAIEGAHSVLNSNLFNLAEQELVDCAGSYGNQGCNGGLMDSAFQYVKAVGGLAGQKDYPYTAADGTCKSGLKRSGAITGFTDVTAGSSDALKLALNKQPVSVAIEADTFAFQGYTSGVITSTACGTNLDHGVVAVGYNDEAQQPYYKVRNSWGASWGEAGYVRIGIKAGDGICGIQKMASYPTI